MAPFRLSKTPRRALFARSERKGRAASSLAVPPFLQNRGESASLGCFLRECRSPGPTWARALSSAGRSEARSTSFHRSRASTAPESLLRTSCLLLPVNTGIDRNNPVDRIASNEYELFTKCWRPRASPLTLRPPERRAGRTLHAVHCVHRDVLQSRATHPIGATTGKQKGLELNRCSDRTLLYNLGTNLRKQSGEIRFAQGVQRALSPLPDDFSSRYDFGSIAPSAAIVLRCEPQAIFWSDPPRRYPGEEAEAGRCDTDRSPA